MSMINAFDPRKAGGLTAREQAMIARRQRLLGPAYRLFYERPVHFVRGEGVWLFDVEGNRYLDVYNNVASVGHAHPAVVAALSQQAATLNTHTRYLHDTVLDYAEKLLATFPAPLSQVMFACTGSEANDLAWRIAKTHTGGTGIIVTELAYHGVTDAVSSFSPSLGRGVPLGDHVRTVPAPDAYRQPGVDVGAKFAADVSSAIEDLRDAGIKPAALLVDTIFSSDGVFVDPTGFLTEGVAVMRAAGGLFIADEVQPGFGRTGTGMWGFERHGIVPDLVTLGKPMGNGHPISAVVVRPELLKLFGERGRYFNTFGGNPVSAAVGLAVLNVIEQEGLMANAAATGRFLRQGLDDLAQKHHIIGNVRGAGLFIGVELVNERIWGQRATAETTQIVNALREERVLISATGPGANILKIRPPLPFSLADAELFLEIFDKVLSRIDQTPAAL